MERKATSGIMLTLLFIGMFTLAFNIQPVRGSRTIYIRPDGSVEGTDKIQRDGDVYTFTDNIYESIVVERDNIIIDGAGYTLEGMGSGCGIDLVGRTNVAVKSTQIKNFGFGIWLYSSSNNTFSGNNITANNGYGIELYYSSSYNSISGNNIANNGYGIRLYYSSNNIVCHNNFIDNSQQVYSPTSGYANIWDDGYPSGGNYWSDYEERYPDASEIDGSGIWDTPYVIDGNNQDNYPLMEPWSPMPPTISAVVDIDPATLNLRSKGKWITAYIQLPEDYNAADVDATTILLNDTIAPVLDPEYGFVINPSEYLLDHNNDGILERMVKFDRAEVMALLSVGENTLTITGNFLDGTPFRGSDTIRVIVSMRGPYFAI